MKKILCLGLVVLGFAAIADTVAHGVCKSTSAEIADFYCHGPKSQANTLGDGGWKCEVYGFMTDVDAGVALDVKANGDVCTPGPMNAAALVACRNQWQAAHCP